MSELGIWNQVVHRALRDLCETDDGLRDEVIRWMRGGSGEDFLTVCSAADLESSAVARLAHRILDLGPARGKVYLTQVMEVTTGDRDQGTID